MLFRSGPDKVWSGAERAANALLPKPKRGTSSNFVQKTGRHRNVEMFRKAKAFSKSRIDKCCESLERKCPFEVVFKVIKRARWLQRQSVQCAFDVTARQPGLVEEASRLARENGLVSARENKIVDVPQKLLRSACKWCALLQAHGFAFHAKCYFCYICFVGPLVYPALCHIVLRIIFNYSYLDWLLTANVHVEWRTSKLINIISSKLKLIGCSVNSMTTSWAAGCMSAYLWVDCRVNASLPWQ